MFTCIVDNDNSNTNKSFDENDDGNNNQYDESPSSKERKTEMNPSSKKSAFYSLLFSLSLYRILFFFLLSGFVVVARSKALLFFFFFFLHTTTFCCIYAPAFIIIQPSDRRISCSLVLQHTFNHYRQENERE